ncbi:MAG: type II secretion system protein [Luteolibacter sp.]
MYSLDSKTRPRRQSRAFTLVEMLVVIAIMSILMTAGAIGLGGMSGKGVSTGVAASESLFDEARATAVGRNLRACVLVAKKLDNSPADDLRRIVIAYEAVETNPAAANFGQAKNPDIVDPKNLSWVLSSRGSVLPEQVYFSDKLSKQNHQTGTGAIDTTSNIVDASNQPIKSSSPLKGTYYIYAFNAQGICYTPGASFIIGNGTRNTTKSSTDEPPRVTAASKRDFGGFVVWRNGRTSIFRSPEQMGSALTNLDSGKPF